MNNSMDIDAAIAIATATTTPARDLSTIAAATPSPESAPLPSAASTATQQDNNIARQVSLSPSNTPGKTNSGIKVKGEQESDEEDEVEDDLEEADEIHTHHINLPNSSMGKIIQIKLLKIHPLLLFNLPI